MIPKSVQVVGGAEHGGIIVRSGCELTSEMAVRRLSTGSVVKDPLMGHPYWGHPIGRNLQGWSFWNHPWCGSNHSQMGGL